MSTLISILLLTLIALILARVLYRGAQSTYTVDRQMQLTWLMLMATVALWVLQMLRYYIQQVGL